MQKCEKNNEKRAVVLAGGKGTRLRPYTIVFPKPLVPVGNYPILEIIIRQLASYGFTRVTIAVNYQADLIKTFFGDGSRWGIDIDYSLERKPLSTIAPLKLIKDLPDNFLLMNGDILTDLNFDELYNYHAANENIFTISSYQREVKSEFGVLEIDSSSNLIGFKEKPIQRYSVSMGVYAVSNRILDYIPEDTFYGFDHLMIDLIKDKKHPKIYKFDGYWLDIGRPDDYQQAIDVFETKDSLFLRK